MQTARERGGKKETKKDIERERKRLKREQFRARTHTHTNAYAHIPGVYTDAT